MAQTSFTSTDVSNRETSMAQAISSGSTQEAAARSMFDFSKSPDTRGMVLEKELSDITIEDEVTNFREDPTFSASLY